MTLIAPDAVDAWLDAFSAAVRAGDLEAGRALFDAKATGFGTVVTAYTGIEDLVASQWSDVWPRTEGFDFDEVDRRWHDGGLCVVAATWSSTGTDGGARRTRTGRVTLVLQQREDGLVAVHSHFSMTPGTPA